MYFDTCVCMYEIYMYATTHAHLITYAYVGPTLYMNIIKFFCSCEYTLLSWSVQIIAYIFIIYACIHISIDVYLFMCFLSIKVSMCLDSLHK